MWKEYIKIYLNKYPNVKRRVKTFYHILQNLKILSTETKRSRAYDLNKNIIYFDITSYSVTDVKTGIQRVVKEFIEYYKKVDLNNYELVFISGLSGYHIIDKIDFSSRYDLKIEPKAGDIYLSIDFNPVQPVEYWSTLKKWQDKGCKIIGCVYDLVYVKYPEFVSDNNAVYLMTRWLKHATKNYDGLICISKTVEDELLEWIRINKIVNSKLITGYFHLGADFITQRDDISKHSQDVFFEKIFNKRNNIFLSVATIEPRKGYIELVEAFEKANDKNINVTLIIVGRVGWRTEKIIDKIVNSSYYNEKIFWFNNCDDQVLQILYKISDCYISNSYYEGFGLGIIEASNLGLPILLRDIQINREVTENKAIFYKNKDDLVDKLYNITNKADIINNQLKINSLSWQESVDHCFRTIFKMIKEND